MTAFSADPTTGIDRRAVLATIGMFGTGVLAGCLQGDSGDGDGDCPPDPDTDSPVPDAYRSAESIAEIQRRPAELLSKTDAGYQSRPNGDQECSKCSYYVEDRNGDCVGACVRVAGRHEPDGWCEYYRSHVGGGW